MSYSMCPHCDEYSMPPAMADAVQNYKATEAELATLRAENARLREALEECADDLEAEVNDRYPPSQMAAYPDQQRKRERDMQPVVKARAALAPQETGV